MTTVKDTKELAYKSRLVNADVWWKRLFDVQRPYRANLKSLDLNNVLDVGCGIGRNLANLQKLGVSAIGVDHNEHSVSEARSRGFEAITTTEFEQSFAQDHEHFDAILISHVLEHMSLLDAVSLLKFYVPYLKPGGQVIAITPQEAGYKTDPTHVHFVDLDVLEEAMKKVGLRFEKGYSFPFPRWAGKYFRYNEFVAVGRI